MEIDGIEIRPGVNLEGKDLANQDLRGSDLTVANLKGANLTDANLTDANLTDTNLDGAFLTKAKLRFSTLKNISAQDTSFRQADFYGSELSMWNSSGADFTDANFIGARLNGFLDGINFSKAKFEYTSFGSDLSFGECRFWNSDLSKARIKSCAILNENDDGYPKQISIAGTTSWAGVTIADSVLRRLDFYPNVRADLNGLHVENSDLSFFRMHEGSLSHSIFSNVNLSSSNLNGDCVKSEFVECDFSGTKFYGDCRGTSFIHCKFDQTSFNAHLKGSIFEGPGLDQIDFGDSDFGDNETL